jgi:hypothetical protein
MVQVKKIVYADEDVIICLINYIMSQIYLG